MQTVLTEDMNDLEKHITLLEVMAQGNGGFISEYDMSEAQRLAEVLKGLKVVFDGRDNK